MGLDGVDATQMSIMTVMWFSMNFIVVITLLSMRYRSILEIAGLEDRNDVFLDLFAEQLRLSGQVTLDSAVAALSIASAASKIRLGRLFGAADHGTSSPVTWPSSPSKLLPCSTAISNSAEYVDVQKNLPRAAC